MRRVLLCLLLTLAVRSAAAQRFAAVDSAIHAGIATGIYPAAVVVVGRSDTMLYYRGYGHFTWSPTSRVPDPSITRWDLASLSKVVATTSAAAMLVQQHRLDLDAPVSRYLPEFSGGRKSEVSVRMLMNHTSGMPAYTRLWLVAHTPTEARSKLMAVPLQRVPGASAVYSDLNAMLAGLVVERAAGQPLDRVADSAVFRQLGMLSTHYRPSPADRLNSAPTGRFRGQPVAGVVNDQNAVVLGGVSGHAGVFSTAFDLGHFAQGWLKAANGHGELAEAAHRGRVSGALADQRHPGTRVGYADSIRRQEDFAVRSLRHDVHLRAHRLDRHRNLDRSRPGPVRRAAHQSELRTEQSEAVVPAAQGSSSEGGRCR